LCFYLNKGVQRLYFYGAAANEEKTGDVELGMLSQNFLGFSKTAKTYPQNDAALTSPAMNVIKRISDRMKSGLNARLEYSRTRKLEVVSVQDGSGVVFEGAPKNLAAHPPLLHRDVFAFLPFQANATRFVIPYDVMTRELRNDLAPQNYLLSLRGFQAKHAQFSACDPLADKDVPVKVLSCEGEILRLQLSARDYPLLLTIQK
jgi:hypothetical protein